MTIEELNSLVEMRLLTLGYPVTEADQKILSHVTGHAAQYVCTFCNFPRCPDDIPGSLRYVTVDYAVGNFLQHKKTFAPDDLTNLNLDVVVKQITTGDTTTVFATGEGSQTDEQKLNSFISYLMTYGKQELNSHRRVKW
jgi:hypothetical protein|nr:MAG TPA: tail connector protein [Caudoviricetes sp.]